ncbi:MAG: peroxiredoxin [Aureispira sp.]|nr:peroxiredoxin [Aureispira sp.]
MSKLKLGDSIPSFELKDQEENLINSNSLKGKPLVIYFYPKDDTPGCTAQACSFRDNYEEFEELGALVIGISGDSPKSHLKFAQKHRLPFMLLSDVGNKVRKQFGVPGSLFGMLPGRVTYVFDNKGSLIHIFNSQLKAKAHIPEALRQLQKTV